MTAMDEFTAALDEVAAQLPDQVSTDAEAQTVSDLLAKGGPLTALKAKIGALDNADKPEAGRLAGEVRNRAQAMLDAYAAERDAAARSEQLAAERLDLTEVGTKRTRGHAHLVTQAWERLEDLFVGMGYTVSEGPEIETDWYNFEALNFPEGHTARDLFDTLYLHYGEEGNTLLRTHTSPVQIRAMLDAPPPIYTVAPGRTFRQDTADATHMPVFHQIEGLVVDRGITMGDLAGTIEQFVTAYFGGGFTSRLRPSYFPFTEPSAEFDILMPNGVWLELGGCGMVHPNVLSNCGIDPEEWSGFAFGFGIDRLAMMRHSVDDLREFYTNDIRFLEQF